MSLLPSEKAQYSAIIDDILANGDLTTISAKQIRKGLQQKLEVDISDKKAAVQALILERFDYASSSPPTAAPSSLPPQANGHAIATPIKTETKPTPAPKVKAEAPRSTTPKTEPRSDEDEDEDDVAPPKKKRKAGLDDDAKLAAKLQAQENSRARPTRGGNEKKQRKAPVKKRTPKKRSADKVKAGDDSDLELNSDGEVKEKPKKGGFHKQYHLSAPLAELVGEPTLSRPQVVKKIWEYIKARDLQDPSDKRHIRCDENMQAVFKQDRVHMFTMNKILGKQLYDIEE